MAPADIPRRTNDFLPMRTGGLPMQLVCLLALLAFVDAVFDYFWPANGIHGTEGALLVVVSTLLMLGAAALIATDRVHGWVRVVLEILLVLDFLGTGLAAYLLEAWIVLILDILALAAWVVHALQPARREVTS